MRWVCGYWEPRFLGLACTEAFPISKKKKKTNFQCVPEMPLSVAQFLWYPSGSPVFIIYCDQVLSHLPGHFSYMGTYAGPEWIRAFFFFL